MTIRASLCACCFSSSVSFCAVVSVCWRRCSRPRSSSTRVARRRSSSSWRWSLRIKSSISLAHSSTNARTSFSSTPPRRSLRNDFCCRSRGVSFMASRRYTARQGLLRHRGGLRKRGGDSVAPLRLHSVHGVVGAPQELLWSARVVGERRHAQTGGDLQRPVRLLGEKLPLRDLAPQPLGALHRLVLARFGQEHHELVAAVADRHVGRTQRAEEQAAH